MIKVAICDDNSEDLSSAKGIFTSVFDKLGIDNVLQLFTSAEEMLADKQDIDLAILDIEINGENGIDLGRQLKSRYPQIKIIYITSFEQYCMQAINEIHAFSFLCKPLIVDKVIEQMHDLIPEIEGLKDSIEKTFYKVTNDHGREYPILKININDIIYFEYIKSKRKISIVLKDAVYEYSYVMGKLIDELADYGFAVNCRGCLVNLRHIEKIQGYEVYMDNGKSLPLSQKRVARFKEIMNDYIHHLV